MEQTHEKIPILHVRFLSDFCVDLRAAYGLRTFFGSGPAADSSGVRGTMPSSTVRLHCGRRRPSLPWRLPQLHRALPLAQTDLRDNLAKTISAIPSDVRRRLPCRSSTSVLGQRPSIGLSYSLLAAIDFHRFHDDRFESRLSPAYQRRADLHQQFINRHVTTLVCMCPSDDSE